MVLVGDDAVVVTDVAVAVENTVAVLLAVGVVAEVGVALIDDGVIVVSCAYAADIRRCCKKVEILHFLCVDRPTFCSLVVLILS
ncbi:unnamed protein product [Gongylonema pulchrum]|uniref:Secreted protein n=1 Tax=Gongylonema pulchrum TaxID=637853 RepID=A0A183E2L1_9BILA|nr:unnamed protein product [Gongylonema pulchrum]